MRGIILHRGEIKSTGIVIWVQFLQGENSRKIQQKQVGKISCQY